MIIFLNAKPLVLSLNYLNFSLLSLYEKENEISVLFAKI